MSKEIDKQLFEAIEKGDAEKVKELINTFFLKKLIGKKADVNALDDLEDTPLIKAAYKGQKDIVDILLKAGADVDDQDKFGNSVLIEATKKGHADIVRELIHEGADIDAKDKDGYTALMAASYYGHIEVIKELVKAGVDINAVDEQGKTALMWAVLKKHLPVLLYLRDKKADVNIQAKDNNTALFHAVHLNSENISDTASIKALVTAPVDYKKVNNVGDNPLTLAAKRKLKDAVVLMLKNKGNIK